MKQQVQQSIGRKNQRNQRTMTNVKITNLGL